MSGGGGVGNHSPGWVLTPLTYPPFPSGPMFGDIGYPSSGHTHLLWSHVCGGWRVGTHLPRHTHLLDIPTPRHTHTLDVPIPLDIPTPHKGPGTRDTHPPWKGHGTTNTQPPTLVDRQTSVKTLPSRNFV